MTAATEASSDARATPRPSKATAKAAADEMLAAIDRLRASLQLRLAPGLTIGRDNPGKTPQQWSLTDAEGKVLLSFGLIDRTFFWTWDEGVSNHYAKSREMMARVITGELQRFGHLV